MKSMKSLFLTATLVTLPTLAGCLDLLGFEDPVRDDCAPNGCASGGGGTGGTAATTSNGGSGGAGATGGAGGTGGVPVVCPAGETQPCYGGADGTKDVGICKGGTMTCNADGTAWSGCEGEVLPAQAEVCANQEDEDCNGSACGQALWVKAFDASLGGKAAGVAFDPTGDLVIAGSFFAGLNFPGYPLVSQSNLDIYLAKLDPLGSTIWAKEFGPNAMVVDMAVAPDGGIVIMGLTYDPSTVDLGEGPVPHGRFIARFDEFGKFAWASPYGGWTNECGGITVDESDRVILVDCVTPGITIDFGDGPLDPANGNLFVAVLNGQTGAKQDLRQFPGGGRSKGVTVDSAGSIFVAGNFLSTGDFGAGPWSSVGYSDIFVLKMTASLATVWAQHYGGSIASGADRVVVDALGNPIITGTFNNDVTFDQIELDVGNNINIARFIAKLTFFGLPQWATSIQGPTTISHGFDSDASGSVLLGGVATGPIDIQGHSFGSNGGPTAFLTKLLDDGTFSWARVFAPGVTDAIVSTPGGDDFVLCGSNAAAQSDFGMGALGGQDVVKMVVARYAP